jgi:cell division protein FtsW
MLLLVLQKDLGSTMITALIAVSIYFVAGASWRHFVGGMIAGCFLFLIGFATVDRVSDRVMALLQPPDETEDCEEACWQSKQAKIAIGSGGFLGDGLTGGIQKFWLPQATDDFIFAASAEELGFVRTSLVVILYFIVMVRGYFIASQAPSRFAMLTATGITTWIAAQTFVNIFVNTALFPITGITLPFMSYGGSSMVATLLGIGILLNISGYTSTYAHRFNGGWDRRSHSTQYRPRLRYR